MGRARRDVAGLLSPVSPSPVGQFLLGDAHLQCRVGSSALHRGGSSWLWSAAACSTAEKGAVSRKAQSLRGAPWLQSLVQLQQGF